MGRTARRVLVGVAGIAAAAAVVLALPGCAVRSRSAPAAATVRVPAGSAAMRQHPRSPSAVTVTVPALPPATGGAASSAGVPTATAPHRPGSAREHPSGTRPTHARSKAARSATPTPSAPTPRPARSTPPSEPAVSRAPSPRAPASTTARRATAPPGSATPTSARTPSTTARSTPKPARPDFGIPVAIGNAAQIVTVTAASSSATTGTLRAWQRSADGTWSVVLGPYPAWLGSQGIGHQSEYVSRTPLGTFTLTRAFGRLANPGTALPYHQTTPDDWWVSDVNSPVYNTMQTCAPADCPFDTSVSEHLYYVTPEYDYAVVMDVNTDPVVPGAGSAFFLHITNHEPTAGCVAIDRDDLLAVMRWLRPSQHPRIATGID